MKKTLRIPPIFRSLVGQTTLLSLALLLLALTYLVFVPILSMDRSDPVRTTLLRATSAVFQTLNNADTPLEAIRDAEPILQAQEANRQFRLYVRHGSEELKIGGAARWANAIDYSKFWSSKLNEATSANLPASSYVDFEFDEGTGIARVSYSLREEQETFVEIGGIQNASEQVTGWLGGVSPAAFWWWSRNYLAVGGAILFGVLCLLFILARSLRRVAGVAQSLDPQAPSHVLPEKRLPTEILPMVRAINRMIRRIDEANKEQAFFLAAAAHELRTPLAIVRTRLENLPDGPDKEELKDDLRRMTSLVDQLLRLMSVRNKGAPSQTVDLVSVARNVVAERAPLVIDKGVEIDLDANGESVQVRGDERLLRVALANLVDNALSFSKSGQRLEVQVDPRKKITVRDQGPGIPDKELENIFRPFAKNPPNRRGHGLGLAITRSIMALHGGSVNATNLKGGGASFALQF